MRIDRTFGINGDSKSVSPVATRKWNVLLYLAGDQHQESTIAQKVVDAEKIGSSDEISIIAQIDRGPNPFEQDEIREGGYTGKLDDIDIDGNWNGAKRLYIVRGKGDSKDFASTPGPGENPATPPVDLGPVNMSDPKVLTDFIVWGMKTFPAERHLIVIDDHGGGFRGAVYDQESKGWMDLPAISKAIEDAENITGQKVDMIGFSACFMAQLEVANELKDRASIMIGSEQFTSFGGWWYSALLGEAFRQIKEKGQLTPVEMASIIIEASKNTPGRTHTLSAIDLEKIEPVVRASEDLAQAILRTSEKPQDKKILRKTVDSSQHYSWKGEPEIHFKDVIDLAEKMSEHPEINAEIKESARNLMEKVKQCVIAESHSTNEEPSLDVSHSHGLSIYFPTHSHAKENEYNYEAIDFARRTSWLKMLKEIMAEAGECPMSSR